MITTTRTAVHRHDLAFVQSSEGISNRHDRGKADFARRHSAVRERATALGYDGSRLEEERRPRRIRRARDQHGTLLEAAKVLTAEYAKDRSVRNTGASWQAGEEALLLRARGAVGVGGKVPRWYSVLVLEIGSLLRFYLQTKVVPALRATCFHRMIQRVELREVDVTRIIDNAQHLEPLAEPLQAFAQWQRQARGLVVLHIVERRVDAREPDDLADRETQRFRRAAHDPGLGFGHHDLELSLFLGRILPGALEHGLQVLDDEIGGFDPRRVIRVELHLTMPMVTQEFIE